MIDRASVVFFGKIRKPHGVYGDFLLWCEKGLLSENPPSALFLEHGGLLVPYRTEKWEWLDSERVLVQLSELERTREAVKELLGISVYVLADYLTELDGEKHGLIGYVFEDKVSCTVGRVVLEQDFSGNRVLTVQDSKGKEYLVSFHEDLVEELDVKGRRLVMSLPEGLF